MKRNARFLLPVYFYCTAITFLFVFAGCSEPAKEGPKAFDLTAARKQIEDANGNFMSLLSKGDSIGLANCYTADAKMMEPNAPAVVGRKNIQGAVAGMMNSGVAQLNLTTSDVWGTEALLAEEGSFTLAAKDGKELDKGKYIVLWKQEDGKWKLFRDCFSSDLPAPPSK
jgi:ketosteroid isomerase-like protein